MQPRHINNNLLYLLSFINSTISVLHFLRPKPHTAYTIPRDQFLIRRKHNTTIYPNRLSYNLAILCKKLLSRERERALASSSSCNPHIHMYAQPYNIHRTRPRRGIKRKPAARDSIRRSALFFGVSLTRSLSACLPAWRGSMS